MISLERVIRHFGQEALRQLKNEQESRDDLNALEVLGKKAAPNRMAGIRRWLQSYEVFQGIDGPRRDAIATAVLEWADSRDLQRDLTSVDALAEAHVELNSVCTRAYGEERDFTSLASKALWLCYPDSVPIFDSFAQRALWVISKLEPDIDALPGKNPEYRKFVHIWKALYDRYGRTLEDIGIENYPYRVRIFDRILWIIGEPRFGVRG
jgi:hypothetical protein